MIFDESKMNRWRDLIKATAPDYFNDFEPTPHQLDTAVEMFKLWAMDAELVEQHLRRIAA